MNDAELAIAVAAEGAAVVRECFGTTLKQLDKGGGDFATNADVEAEQAMVVLLRRERKADAVLGEEMGASGDVGARRRWLIDPLCGTLNYAAGMRVVAVNVALCVDGNVTAAAVADPFAGEVYWAGDAAAFVRKEGRDVRLAPGAESRLVDLNLDPPFPSAPAFRAGVLAADHDFLARFRPRVVSTSMALTWVATGQRAAYITDGDVRNSVHFAAGMAVCEAAGCVLSDLFGAPWGRGATGLIVAANFETHRALTSQIARYFSGE
jgi:myo-inositol-1(or 4)-monophosphatase